MAKRQYTVLVVGCGEMGSSHARAYEKIPEYEIVGLVSRNPESRERLNRELAGDYPLYADFEEALEQTNPEIVSLSTYPNTHAPFALKALEKGCHLFIEKPSRIVLLTSILLTANVRITGFCELHHRLSQT